MRTTFAALRHRDYRIWAGAGFVSVAGTWMQVLGVNWYVLQQTGSATQMGFAVLLQALPVLLLSSWGGVLADRLPARPLLITTQVSHGALAAALAVIAATSAGGLPAVYAISLLGGVVSALEGPVMGRFGALLVDRDTLGNALALGSLTNSAGRILGMSAGGVFVAGAGPAPLFAINAASFAAVVGALLAVHAPRAAAPEPAGDGGGVRAGFAYLIRQPVVLTALALAFVLGSLGRNYQVTMAAMSAGPLGGGAGAYGALSTVFAVGTVLGGFAAAHRGRLGYRTLVGAGLLASVLQLAAGLMPGVWSFATVILPIAAAAVLIDTTVSARVQLDTREDMRGRVLAALAVTGSVAGAGGAPLLGWLAEHAGARQTLVLAGAAAAVASMAAGVALARLHGRKVRPVEVRITLRESVGIDAARLRSRAALSRMCPAGHAPAPAWRRATRTARPAHECAACAPRYGRLRGRSAAAATPPAGAAG
jgi:MFS family permease